MSSYFVIISKTVIPADSEEQAITKAKEGLMERFFDADEALIRSAVICKPVTNVTLDLVTKFEPIQDEPVFIPYPSVPALIEPVEGKLYKIQINDMTEYGSAVHNRWYVNNSGQIYKVLFNGEDFCITKTPLQAHAPWNLYISPEHCTILEEVNYAE